MGSAMVSDMGTDPCVQLVKATTLGHGDTIQNLTGK